MVSPQENVASILANNPEAVEALYGLLVWMSNVKGVAQQSEREDLMILVYSKTQDSEKHRHEQDKKLLAGRPMRVQEDSRMTA